MKKKEKKPQSKAAGRKISKTAAIKPKKSNLKKGAALRTRDEFLEGGVPKEEFTEKPDQFYRVVYTIAVNELNEVAVVKRTTKKGRHLKSKPTEKFREQIITKDNESKGIKVGKKFVRSQTEDITKDDVDYIISRLKHYPDTKEKMREFKSRKKSKKNPPK